MVSCELRLTNHSVQYYIIYVPSLQFAVQIIVLHSVYLSYPELLFLRKVQTTTL